MISKEAMKFTQETTSSSRKKINARKLYGVLSNIKEYKKAIFETFYDEKELDKLIKDHSTEALDFIGDYFEKINRSINDLLQKARDFILDSFTKGASRVRDNKGDLVRIDVTPDETAIDILLQDQENYFKGLSRDQSKRINKIIADGMNSGKSTKAIAGELKNRIKRLTLSRANTIAKSEIVKAHNKGQIETMKLAGVEYYNYITSNDSKVSKICKAHQGPIGREKKYRVDLAGSQDNPLPVVNSHPNCRCTTVIWRDN